MLAWDLKQHRLLTFFQHQRLVKPSYLQVDLVVSLLQGTYLVRISYLALEFHYRRAYHKLDFCLIDTLKSRANILQPGGQLETPGLVMLQLQKP